MEKQQKTKPIIVKKFNQGLEIEKYLDEARHYLKLRKLAEENPELTAPSLNPKYEALAPVLDGTLPVIISVEKAKDIELAIKFVKKHKLKAIFRGSLKYLK